MKLTLVVLLLLSTSVFATSQTVDAFEVQITAKTWQGHLWDYVFAHPELNSAQKAWLDKAIFKFEGKDLQRDRAQLTRSFIFARQEATVLFGESTARELLLSLDPPKINYLAIEKPICPCATESDWCNGIGYRCISAGSNCTWQEMGCGTFMLESCNGLCLYCPGCN